MCPNTPKLTVDAVIILDNKLVLIKRKNPPFQGKFALPGGFVDVGETTEMAVEREVNEETGLTIEIVKLLGVYSEPSRDPRGHTVSIVYLVLGNGTPKPNTDAKEVHLFDIQNIPEMAFDHNLIIENARSDIYGILSRM